MRFNPLHVWPSVPPQFLFAVLFMPSCYFFISFLTFHLNRSLALRGHVTNTSLKQSLGILLMPKIDRAHKNSLTPEIWEENHLREIFYGTLIFQQSSMICILLPSNMAAKTTFCLYLVKRLIVTLRCAVNVTTSFFQHFPWSLSAKFAFRKK